MGGAGFIEEFGIGVQDSLHGEFGMGIQDSSLGNLSGGSGFPVIHRDAIFPRRCYSGMPEFKEGGGLPCDTGADSLLQTKDPSPGVSPLESGNRTLFFFFFFDVHGFPPPYQIS